MASSSVKQRLIEELERRAADDDDPAMYLYELTYLRSRGSGPLDAYYRQLAVELGVA